MAHYIIIGGDNSFFTPHYIFIKGKGMISGYYYCTSSSDYVQQRGVKNHNQINVKLVCISTAVIGLKQVLN